MGGRGCLLLDNLEDLLEARLETVGGDTCEETPGIKALESRSPLVLDSTDFERDDHGENSDLTSTFADR